MQNTEMDSLGEYYIRDPKEGVMGKALIINISQNRPGSEEDVKMLDQMFRYLNMSVTIKTDLPAAEIFEAVETFSETVSNESLGRLNSLILILLLH